ncbi:MAG: carotenoid oxygenase family protein [Pseudomonadota bacterium]
MATWMFVLISALVLLVLAGILSVPRLVSGWAERLRSDPAIDAYNETSAYGLPGFDPVHTEMDRVELVVEGALPEDLEGVYLRNGTNRQFTQTRSRLHMFNGAGMLHEVQIRDGRAWYSNCFVRTPRYCHEREAGRELYPEFGDIAGNGKKGLARIISSALEKRLGLVPALSNMESASATTAIQYHHDKLYALQETAHPFSLKTWLEDGLLVISGEGDFDSLGGRLGGPFTAHPKVDPNTGDWHAFSTNLQSGEIFYSVLREGALAWYRCLTRAKPAMAFVHDGFLTANYAIFPDLSLRFDPGQMFKGPASAFYYDADYAMRFGLVDRSDGEDVELRWLDAGMHGHIWHTVNGWEAPREGGGTDLVLVAPVFSDYPANVPIHSPAEPHAHLYKFIFDLDSGELRERRCLLEHFYERPSINTAWLGKPSRFAYLIDEAGSGGIMGSGVLKYDLHAEQPVATFDYGDCRGGEALFVARPGAGAEDNGYLLELLMNKDGAALLILDAATMAEVARLPLPQRVPYGVHACWLNPAQVASLA